MTELRRQFGPTRRNVAFLAVVTGLLLLSHVVVPHWSTRYGAYLLVFSIWMGWFVWTLAEWL